MVLIAPGTVLNQIRDALILPAYRWYQGERPYVGMYSSHFMPRVEEMFFEAELVEDEDFNRQFDPLSRDGAHLYGGFPELQAWLLTPMAGLAAVVGLIAAGRSARPDDPLEIRRPAHEHARPARLADLDALQAEGQAAFARAGDAEAIEAARIEFLGQKQGRLKSAQERLKTLEPSAKKAYGQRFNAAKQAIEAAFEAAKVRVERPSAVD